MQSEEQQKPDDAPENAGSDENDRPCEAVLYARAQDKGYSIRRAFYVGLSTAFCLIVSAVLVFGGYNGPLTEVYVKSLMEFAIYICGFYLGAGVLDRSQILHRIGDGWGRRGDWRRDSDETEDKPEGQK
jgi:hypothetical protein